MLDFERVVLAALMHDLPSLLDHLPGNHRQGLDVVLRLARLDNLALHTLVNQAEQYAAPDGRHAMPVAQEPLLSIFSRLSIRAEKEPLEYHHSLHPLRATNYPQDDLFPTPEGSLSGLDDYLVTLAQPLTELKPMVEEGNFPRLYSHLIALLHQYCYCLAAHSSDVSLFDHLRLTSGIAACLYRYHESELALKGASIEPVDNQFGLVVGDLSGIQEYIFGITTLGAGGVARRLRARSLRLSIISDGISHLIAHQFQVPLGNVIMASGGRFYVLVPNTEDMKEKLQTIQHQVDEWLRDISNGELAVNLAWIAFSGQAFASSRGEREGFGDVITKLNQILAVRKRRRGQSMLQDEDGWKEEIFAIKRDFWGSEACACCQKFPASPGEVCQHCNQDLGLGRVLPEARYIAYFRETPSCHHISLPSGYAFAMLKEKDIGELSDEPYLLTQLNDPDITSLRDYPSSFRFLATYVPVFTSEEELAEFSQEALGREHGPSDLERWGIELDPGKRRYPILRTFAALADAVQGRPLLGYVKADVDHLGLAFAQGLRRGEKLGYDTAPHQATLSRQLDWFFSGYIQHLLSRDEDYRDFYTIFSGGDDLFLVGPWDRAAALARQIYRRFRIFTSQNPELTLSTGILFTKERYPISRGAADAEILLKQSKERVWEDGIGNRDQLTILGDTFRWDEGDKIFAEIEKLKRWSDAMPSAFLHNLVGYWRLYRLWVDEGQIEGLRYKPLFAYNIARNLRRGDPGLYRWADGLMQSLHAEEPNLTMRHLGLIATYLLFARRTRR